MNAEVSDHYAIVMWVRLHENNNGRCNLVAMVRDGGNKMQAKAMVMSDDSE